GEPRTPWQATRSQAVVQAPGEGTSSMCASPAGAAPRVSARTRSLPPFLAAAAAGSARAAPSPPPSRLVPDQARTARARWRNMGPRTERSRVCPVLPSRPAGGRPAVSAASASAGRRRPAEGGELTEGQPARTGAAASEAQDDGAGEVVAADEVADVGGEDLDPVVLGTDGPGSLSPSGPGALRPDGPGPLNPGPLSPGAPVPRGAGAGGGARRGPARPDLPVGGEEFGVHGGGQAVGQDAAGGEVFGTLGERAVDGVVAAEDEGGQRGQAAVGEVGGLGDHAGRRVE